MYSANHFAAYSFEHLCNKLLYHIQEKLRRIALRKHLDQLGELVVEKEYSVQQARYYIYFKQFLSNIFCKTKTSLAFDFSIGFMQKEEND